MSYSDIEAFLKNIGTYRFAYSAEKDAQLKLERGIGFEEIIGLMTGRELVAVKEHHNPAQYPHQLICEIEINGYVYIVPVVMRGKDVFLKTLYPSRKATKKRKKSGEENGKAAAK